MITVTVKLEFSAAKRLLHLDGPCNRLHGYRHMVEASFSSPDKPDGMVADFTELEAGLHGWLMSNWDHTVILNAEDKALGEVIAAQTGQTIFYLDHDPTAERMAEYLKEEVCAGLFPRVECTSLRLYDSPGAWVDIR